MAHYNVDGVFFHKSIKENKGIRRISDEVCKAVQKAVEKTGRVFSIVSVSIWVSLSISRDEVLILFVGTMFLESSSRRSKKSVSIAVKLLSKAHVI